MPVSIQVADRSTCLTLIGNFTLPFATRYQTGIWHGYEESAESRSTFVAGGASQ